MTEKPIIKGKVIHWGGETLTLSSENQDILRRMAAHGGTTMQDVVVFLAELTKNTFKKENVVSEEEFNELTPLDFLEAGLLMKREKKDDSK